MFSKIKRFIVMPVLLASILAGGTAGIVMADEETDVTTAAPEVTLQGLVARYLEVTVDDLNSALREARELVKDIQDPQEAREEFRVAINRILMYQYDAVMTWQEAMEAARETYRSLQQQNKEQRKENNERLQNEMREQLQARKAEMTSQLEARRIQMGEQLEARKTQMRRQLQERKAEMLQQRNERRNQLQVGNAERRGQQGNLADSQGQNARRRMNRANVSGLLEQANDIPVEVLTENITVY